MVILNLRLSRASLAESDSVMRLSVLESCSDIQEDPVHISRENS